MRKTFRRSLAAALCAAMMLNPVTTAYASQHEGGIPRSPEITEEYLQDKIPVQIYVWECCAEKEEDGTLFVGRSPYFKFRADVSITITSPDGEDVIDTIELGEFYTGTEQSLLFGIPTSIRDKYNDSSRYRIFVNIDPVDLPEDKVLIETNTMTATDSVSFEYDNQNELKGDIDITIAEKISVKQKGVIHLKAPEKREYHIGEEFDITGGKISGFGELFNETKQSYEDWKIEERELTLDDLDISNFDNTKAGEYLITAKPVNFNTTDCSVFSDMIVYDSFYVTVVDDNVPETTEPAPEELKKGEQFKLTFNKFVSNDYDEELQNNVLRTEKLKGMEFDLEFDVFRYSDDGSERVDHMDMGHFTMGDASSITITIPDEILKKYSDTDIYQCDFTLTPTNLPDDKVLSDFSCLNSSGYSYYAFSPSFGETVFDILVRDKKTCISEGSISLEAPEKVIYRIGEELDLTGSRISGCGGCTLNGDTVLKWDNFAHQPSIDELDVSGFDNTKAGEYTIRPLKMNTTIPCDETVDKISYGSFTVTVVDDESSVSTVRGDANLDKDVNISDAVCIMQCIANPGKFRLSEQAKINADITGDNDGVTSKDALVIQKYMLKLIDEIK